jgi:hypothetical protein
MATLEDPSREFAHLPFAQYLDKAMESQGLSPQALSDRIRHSNHQEENSGIKERTIRGWRTGERLPTKLDKIQYLAEALECSFDELEQCLIDSLRKKTTKGKKKAGSKTKKTEQPLSVPRPNILLHPEEVRSPEGTIRGKAALNQAIINMIKSLGKPSDDKHNKILINFQSKEFVFDEEYRDSWRESLRKAIEDGWYIEHIIQMQSRDRDRILATISNILRFISVKDQYSLHKIKDKKILYVSSGMIVIPGRAAIQCYATTHSDYIDGGFFFDVSTDDQKINLLQENYKLLKDQSEPVYQKFDSYEQKELLDAFSQSDQATGDRTVIVRRLSEITRPETFYQTSSNWARAIQKYYCFNDEDLGVHISSRKRRHDEFRKLLKSSKYRYIFYERYLDEFVKHGNTYPYYFTATVKERLDQIKETRSLFSDNANLEIAIISKEEEAIIGNIKPTFCEVKDGIIVIMEVPTGEQNLDGSFLHKWFLIKDPAITNAFQRHLSDLWNSLRDESKEPRSTLKWLDQQIALLEKMLINEQESNTAYSEH